MAAESYSVEAALSLVDKGFSQGMQAGAQQAARLQAQIDKMNGVDATFNKFSSGAKTIGNAMMGAGAAVSAMGVKSLTGFGNFQQSLNKAAVVAGGTSKDIGGLADVANKMGAELPLSAQDAADAMVQMAQDGASIGTIKEEFPAIAQAATAAGSDLQATAGVVQTAMNIWGKSIGSSAQAAAVLTETANVSNASVGDMQQAFADVGTMASQLGMNMQDTSTAIGMVTNSGVPAAQAAQDLNFALTKMLKPSKAAAGVAKGLGISYYNANGKMKSMPQILSQVAKATSGMTDKQKQNALVTMYGTAGYKAMGPLLKSITDKSGKTSSSWEAMSKAINHASSSQAQAQKTLSSQASEMQKNVGSKIEQVGGNWEALSNKAAAAKGGVTGSMLDMMNGALEWAGSSNSSAAKVARGFVGLAPVIGPAVTGAGLFLRNLGPMVKLAGSTGKALISMGKSMFGLVAKLLGVGTAGTAAGAGEKAAGEGAKTSAKDMLAMGLAVLEIGAGIGIAAAGIALLVVSIAQLAKTGTSGVIALGAFVVAVAALAGVFALLGPALSSGAVGIVAFGVAILAIGVGVGAASAGLALLVTAITSLGASVATIVPALTALGVGFATMLASFVVTLVSYIPQVVAGMMQIVSAMLNALVIMIPQFVTAGLQLLLGLLQGINSNIAQITTTVLLIIANFLNAIASNLGAVINAGVNLIVAFVEGIAGNIGRVISAGVDLIIAVVNGVASNLGRIINAAVNLIGSFLIGLARAIPRIADKAYDAVMAFVDGVGYVIGKVLTSGGDLIAHFAAGIVRGMSGSSAAGKKNGDAVLHALSSFNLLSVGANLVKGFIKGIGSMVSSVAAAAADLGSKAVGAVKHALGIHSPSRVMRDEVGRYIPLGLAAGIARQIGAVTEAANQMAAAAVPTVSMDDIAGTVNMANAKLQQGLNASVSVNANSSQVRTNQLLQQLVDKNSAVYMDSEPVGKMMDRRLGGQAAYDERWSR